MKSNFFLVENEILRYILRKTAEKSGHSFYAVYCIYKDMVKLYNATIIDFFDFYMSFENPSLHYLYCYAGKLANAGIKGEEGAEKLKSYLIVKSVINNHLT